MKKKAVVLFSGGLDSTTCLALATSENYDCYAMSFDYGQKHNAELKAAQKIAELFNVKEHKIAKLPIGELGGSALTDNTQAVPDYNGDNGTPPTYVPARNTVFLSMALAWAEVLDAEAIFIGVSAIDYSGYPDCRPEYISAFQNLANLATQKAVTGDPIKIKTPLIELSKAQTILLGRSLRIDFANTVSCYRTTPSGFACGQCDSCTLRKNGFKEAGIVDPTHYLAENVA